MSIQVEGAKELLKKFGVEYNFIEDDPDGISINAYLGEHQFERAKSIDTLTERLQNLNIWLFEDN